MVLYMVFATCWYLSNAGLGIVCVYIDRVSITHSVPGVFTMRDSLAGLVEWGGR